MNENDSLSKSIRRSRDAYSRIKMNMTVEGSEVSITSKYRQPVERIREVIRVLDGIEKAKIGLSTKVSNDSVEERYKEYNNFKFIKEELKEYRKTDIISELFRKIKENMKETEEFLDDIAKKRLILMLQGKSHKNWAEYLVNKEEKKEVFVGIVREYIEATLKSHLDDNSETIADLFLDIEVFAKHGFSERKAQEVTKELKAFANNKIINEVGKRCYIFIKNVNSPIRKLKDYLAFVEVMSSNSIRTVIKKQKIEEKVRKVLVATYRTLHTEAEDQFTTGKVNEKKLFDKDLFHLLEIVHKIEEVKAFLEIRQEKQKKLSEFYEVSKEKSKQASKMEGMIFLLNSVHLINSMRAKKYPEDEIVQEIAQEMKRKINKAVENPSKQNKIGELLRYIEKTSAKTKHYTVPQEVRETLIREYKIAVREIGSKYGGLDDVSDSHLSSTIEGFFNGPARKLEFIQSEREEGQPGEDERMQANSQKKNKRKERK
ncbi:hypothetical protein NEMIN01_1413 [Nematocida minor]|uniref:uncharacterized protein n=1 Tax=Nematocida minor TaxID=1912983 RepID=UPI00221F2210|nr:uncharacterized protein NEMIN01_1413 [Nematocida minor]KAI5191205.1 hypothetical protein NEMIN01_1413 [Nematocida minor]